MSVGQGVCAGGRWGVGWHSLLQWEVVIEVRMCAYTAAAVCKAALGRIIVPR